MSQNASMLDRDDEKRVMNNDGRVSSIVRHEERSIQNREQTKNRNISVIMASSRFDVPDRINSRRGRIS